MSAYIPESLTEIIAVDVLQEVQDKFTEATGLATVITDKDGKPITNPGCFTRLCGLIRSTTEGLARCKQSDARLGLIASRTREAAILPCHCGLLDLAAPIVVNGKYLGAVLCGQVLTEKATAEKKEEIAAYLAELQLQPKGLPELIDELNIVPAEKLRATAGILQMVAENIVSMGLTVLNEKLDKQKNLELMREQAAVMRLENELKTMELKALQSQVNPHFLFNTLNTIVRLAMMEGAEETEKVSFALSQLLRYTLKQIDQEVTLQDEVDHVQEYLLIQQYRYGDRLKSRVEIAKDAAKFNLPIMTLQPLVENAIVHGLEPKIEGGTITIKGERTKSGVKITVEDEGLGMSEQRLAEICHPQAAKTGLGHTTGIGLKNVLKRLQHYFGDGFSYEIYSELGKGTKVILNCPDGRGCKYV